MISFFFSNGLVNSLIIGFGCFSFGINYIVFFCFLGYGGLFKCSIDLRKLERREIRI